MSIRKAILHLVMLSLILFIGFFLASSLFSIGLPILEMGVLVTTGLLSSMAALFFYEWGRKKGGKNSPMFTLAAFGIKFALYMALLIVWYVLAKIDGIKFFITFFIIYLSFTVYLMRYFINALKMNKLNI